MKLLFLEIDKVLTHIDKDIKLSDHHPVKLLNSFLEDEDYRIVFITKEFNKLTERQSFLLASNIGLPVERFITKLEVTDNVLSDVSSYLSTRSDVTAYYVLLHASTIITSYSPYVYSAVGILTYKDIQFITSAVSSIDNVKKDIEDKATSFFKSEVDAVQQSIKKSEDSLFYLDEIQNLINMDKDKYLCPKGFKTLLNSYSSHVTKKQLIDLFRKNGVRSKKYSYILFVFIPSAIVSFGLSLSLVFLLKIIWLLFFIVPSFLLVYSILSEIMDTMQFIED